VAERLQAFRGRTVGDALFARPGGAVYALASLDDPEAGGLVDLDDPDELSARRLRPSQVASRHRAVTQPIALALFDEGADGLSWWSVLEASWTNVTLFAERAAASLAETAPPEPLAVTHPAVRAAAEEIGVTLA
jgi:hypothetical protein